MPEATAPTQIGQPKLVVKPAPLFANFIAVEDTWREKDNSVLTTSKDGYGETFNKTLSDPGVDATAELFLKENTTPLKKGDVLTTTSEPIRSFVVEEAETQYLGGKPCKQSVTLQYKASLNLAVGGGGA